MNKKQAQKAFNELFNVIDNNLPIPGTISYDRNHARFMARVIRIKPQQVYRLDNGIAVRIIEYVPDLQQFRVTRLYDNRRQLVFASTVIDGHYLGYRYKRKHETIKPFEPTSLLIKK